MNNYSIIQYSKFNMYTGAQKNEPVLNLYKRGFYRNWIACNQITNFYCYFTGIITYHNYVLNKIPNKIWQNVKEHLKKSGWMKKTGKYYLQLDVFKFENTNVQNISFRCEEN